MFRSCTFFSLSTDMENDRSGPTRTQAATAAAAMASRTVATHDMMRYEINACCLSLCESSFFFFLGKKGQ